MDSFNSMVSFDKTMVDSRSLLTILNQVDLPGMEFSNPLQSGDVLNDFDFDSFLHDGEGNAEPFDFNGFTGMDSGEIGAE